MSEPTVGNVCDAWIAKLRAMVNEGRIDTSKLDAIAERVIVQLIAYELRNIVDEIMASHKEAASE